MKSFLPSEEYSYAKLPSEFGSTVEPRLTTTPFMPQELPEVKLLFLVYLCVNQAGTDLSIYRSLGINREQLV